MLKNLTERYADDIDEIIVFDNVSSDNSRDIAKNFGVRFVTIKNFSFGGSANMCAEEAKNEVIVIFSAHSFPVSHDFFKLIKKKFEENPNLAGLRCLHSSNDYKNFINKVPATEDPNKSGLIFSGSAFNKSVWEKHPFKVDVPTFEDKEWTKRVLKAGYDIDFVESIFSFKNDMLGNYQLWHQDVSFLSVSKGFIMSIFRLIKGTIIDFWYIILSYMHAIKFMFNKPDKF